MATLQDGFRACGVLSEWMMIGEQRLGCKVTLNLRILMIDWIDIHKVILDYSFSTGQHLLWDCRHSLLLLKCVISRWPSVAWPADHHSLTTTTIRSIENLSLIKLYLTLQLLYQLCRHLVDIVEIKELNRAWLNHLLHFEHFLSQFISLLRKRLQLQFLLSDAILLTLQLINQVEVYLLQLLYHSVQVMYLLFLEFETFLEGF